MNKEIALSNLIEIRDQLKKNDCNFWIQDGTLLGYYRHNDFICHDMDTDLGIMMNSFSPKTLIEILKLNFEIQHVFGYVEDSLEICLIKNNVKTDLFFHYPRGNS